jgi:para-nitrobenzyl esterase
MAICDLIASPLATSLFRRAIVESGHGSMVRSISSTMPLIERLADILGILPTIDGFQSRSIQDAVNAVVTLTAGGVSLPDADGRDPGFGLSPFLPVMGDDVIPEHPLLAARKGAGAAVDLLIGSNMEEMNLYLIPTGLRDAVDAATAIAMLKKSQPGAEAILSDYGLGREGILPGDALCRALTDLVFRLPVHQFAAAHQGRTHLYQFGWRSPAMGGRLGACHGLELPFVFDTIPAFQGPDGLLGSENPQHLAYAIQALWVNFARSGSLPWPEFEAESRQLFQLDTGAVLTLPEMPAARHTDFIDGS